MSMEIKCRSCGYTSPVTLKTIQRAIGGSLILTGAYGWATYLFAGILGLHGGAALIAASLIGAGAVALHKQDTNMLLYAAKKIAILLNDRGYQCRNCGKSDWELSRIEGNEIISGERHKDELDNAFNEAHKELYIVSGFLSSNVVNRNFIEKLERALKRGVNIYLIFSDEESHKSNDWIKSRYEEALETLRNLKKKCPNLYLVSKSTHQKGIIVDRKYAIIGSFNFLSNKSAYRKETSLKTCDQKDIEKFRKDITN